MAMETVHVDLPGDRRYPIYIGDGLLDRVDLLQRHVPGQRVLVVTNETVAPLYLDRWGGCWCRCADCGRDSNSGLLRYG
jgi:3-dehydroquinate synthetase